VQVLCQMNLYNPAYADLLFFYKVVFIKFLKLIKASVVVI